MANKDYTVTIKVDQSPEQVYEAINNARNWWQGAITGNTDKVNDEFTYQMEEFHLSKQKVIELIPNKKIVWLVTDSNLSFTKTKDEWTGTHIIFEIVRTHNKTEVHFTHQGLTPQFECYDACSGGWKQLIEKSLLSLITTGKGVKVF